MKSGRRNVLRVIGDTFLNKRLDFRVRLYNVLAMSGVPISLAMAVSCVYTNAGIGNIIVNLMIAAGSFILLCYSYKSGKYQRCYTLSIIIMFFILFPALFFTAGGYHSGMSHEIRTPINVMLGMNEMILRESGFSRVKEYGQNVENAGKSLLLLINNILDISNCQ